MTSKSSSWVNLNENNKRRMWQWCLSVFLFVVLIAVTFLIVIMSINEDRYVLDYGARAQDMIRRDVYNYASTFIGMSGLKVILITISAAMIAFGGFAFLNDRVKLDFYESMPQKKGSRFAVIWINGVLIFIIPYLVGMLLSYAVLVANGYGDVYAMSEAVKGFIYMLLFYLGVYNLFMFGMMLTGTTFAGVCAFVTLSGYEFAMRGLITIFETTFFRYDYTLDNFFRPIISPFGLITGIMSETPKLKGNAAPYTLGLAVFDLALLVLSYVVYMKRPREAAGKTLVFKRMGGIVKMLLAIPVSAMIAVMIAQKFVDAGKIDSKNMIILVCVTVVAAILCCVLIQGVFEQDIRLALRKKTYWILCSAGAVLIFFGFKDDLLDIDRYVPNPSDVESVVFAPQGYDSQWGGMVDEELNEIGSDDFYLRYMHISDTEGVCELARLSIEKYDDAWEAAGGDEEQMWKSDNAFSPAVIMYRLKSGRMVARNYYVPVKDAEAIRLLDRIMSNEEFVNGYYPIEIYDARAAIDSVDPYELDAMYTDGARMQRLDPDELLELISRYKKDMKNFSYKSRLDELPTGYIRFNIKGAVRNQMYSYDGFHVNQSLAIYPDMSECMGYLKDKGYDFGNMPLADQIDYVVITNYHYDEQQEYLKDNGLEFLSQEDEEKFVRSEEYGPGSGLEEIAEKIYPQDGSLYRWDEGADMDYDYEVRVFFIRGTELGRQYSGYGSYYCFAEGEIPEDVEKDLSLD